LPQFDSAACSLKFTPAPDPTPAFAAALVATYEGTLDCPELNGTRTGEEILAGYHSGILHNQDAPDWFLVSFRNQVIGVLMFGPNHRTATAELSYVGLIPSMRGYGYGGEILRFALRHAAGTGAEWMTLSVDVRNLPAIRLYERHAFRSYDAQDVYLWKPE
jgi:ribosomal protein S18 acetylase RimI-like enzyme